MVSKVAVIALVAIISVPILLGFAMNLDPVTRTDYQATTDTVNVTPLLQNGTSYSNVHADPYELNVNFAPNVPNTTVKTLPYYESVTTTMGSFPIERTTYTGDYPHNTFALGIYEQFYFKSNYDGTGGYMSANITDMDNNPLVNINCLNHLYYVKSESKLYYSYYSLPIDLNSLTINSVTLPSSTILKFSDNGGYTATGYWEFIPVSTPTYYVDFTSGFHFEGYNFNVIKLPDYSKSALITIDLDSISDPNYEMKMNILKCFYTFTKTTVGSTVTWTVTKLNSTWSADLYYDPSRSDNTYQILIEYEDYSRSSSYMYYSSNVEFRYVGGWPSVMGAANVYQTYTDYTRGHTGAVTEPAPNFNYIQVANTTSDRTLTMRMDDALYRGMGIPTITDQTYTPSNFKTNPSTKISSITSFGSAIQFGGNSYQVTNGNITLGTHQYSVNNMVFDSIPSSSGTGYDNRINGYVISTTPTPSTITFNGKWAASISTASMQSVTITETEWRPGVFAWDGIDSNFLMVGLLTALGAFIALGVYSRRSKASVWPLMLVAGGAAFLFLIMM